MPDLQSRYPRQYLLKNISVYIGISGYIGMLVTGEILVGAWTKLFAEALRYPYYRATQANDMAALSIFFMSASTLAIVTRALHHA